MSAPSATLHGIFALNARRRADALAVVDPVNREAFTGGAPRNFTYGEAERSVAALAMQFRSLALPTRCVVGVQFPNTVESYLVALACLQAGLVPAFLSLAWGRDEMARALERCAARAIVAGGEIAGIDHTQVAMDVAADVFGVRYVCGIGEQTVDGVVPLRLSDDADPMETGDAAFAGHPDWPALITFEGAGTETTPIARTHAQMLAGGLAAMLEAALPRGCVLATTMLPGSFAALACGFVPWLLTGGTLVLHQPFDPVALRAQLDATPANAIAVPGPLIKALGESGMIGAAGTHTLAVWRTPSQHPDSPAWKEAGALTDVLAFDETAVVPLRRDAEGAPRPLPFGAVRTPSWAVDGQTVLRIERTAEGGLAFSGPMVPASATPAVREDEPEPARQMAG